jgi:hypothetical protein
MDNRHFLILQSLGLDHSLRRMTRHKLHVTLRRFDVSMPEQALHASDIDATHDPLRGSKMSQVVKTQAV